MRKRVLIVANGFVNDAPHALPAEVLKFADPDSDMHVVVPPHVSRLQSLCSDVDASRADARARLDRILQHMTALGLSATGQTGDEDQLQAVEDALTEFHADAILLVTHVPDQQNWRERQLAANAAQFGLPVQGALITRDGTVAGPLDGRVSRKPDARQRRSPAATQRGRADPNARTHSSPTGLSRR